MRCELANIGYCMKEWKFALCVVISDNILNVYVFKVNSLLCELLSDESIADIESIRSAICGMNYYTFSVC